MVSKGATSNLEHPAAKALDKLFLTPLAQAGSGAVAGLLSNSIPSYEFNEASGECARRHYCECDPSASFIFDLFDSLIPGTEMQ